MMIPCCCEDKGCANKLIFNGRELWLNHEVMEGRDLLFYMDANALVNVIKEAKKALLEIAEVKE